MANPRLLPESKTADSHDIDSCVVDDIEAEIARTPLKKNFDRTQKFNDAIRQLEKRVSADEFKVINKWVEKLTKRDTIFSHALLHFLMKEFEKEDEIVRNALTSLGTNIFLAIGEMYRKIFLMSQVTRLEEQNREASARGRVVFQKLGEVQQGAEKLPLDSNVRMQLAEFERRAYQENLDTFFENTLSYEQHNAKNKWAQFESQLAIVNNVQDIESAKEKLRVFYQAIKDKLSHYQKDDKKNTLVEPFMALLSQQNNLQRYASIEFQVEQYEDQCSKLLAMIPEIKCFDKQTLNDAFPKQNPFPFSAIQLAIIAKKPWFRSSEWDVLEECAKTIDEEWDVLLEGLSGINKISLQDHLGHIQEYLKEINELKAQCKQQIDKLTNYKKQLEVYYNANCQALNAHIRQKFLSYKKRNEWEALIRFCEEKLIILDGIQPEKVVERNNTKLRQPQSQQRIRLEDKPAHTTPQELIGIIKKFEEDAQRTLKKYDEAKQVLDGGSSFEAIKNVQIVLEELKEIQARKVFYKLSGPIPLEAAVPQPIGSMIHNVFGDSRHDQVVQDLKTAFVTKNAAIEGCLRLEKKFQDVHKTVVQCVLLERIHAIIAALFDQRNLPFLNQLVTFRSQYQVNDVQVPHGFAAIYQQVSQPIDPQADRRAILMAQLRSISFIAAGKEQETQRSCCQFFRKKLTSNAYAFLATISGLVASVEAYGNLSQIIADIDDFQSSLNSVGNRSGSIFIDIRDRVALPAVAVPHYSP